MSLAISTPDRQRTLDQTAIVNHRFCKAGAFETSFHSVRRVINMKSAKSIEYPSIVPCGGIIAFVFALCMHWRIEWCTRHILSSHDLALNTKHTGHQHTAVAMARSCV